jgi:hypothetical protein
VTDAFAVEREVDDELAGGGATETERNPGHGDRTEDGDLDTNVAHCGRTVGSTAAVRSILRTG